MSELKEISGSFLFDPADKIYQEHFPGNPVVPGSLIIDAFVRAIKNIAVFTESFSVKNFRFKNFIQPGVYTYTISKTDTVFSCKLFNNNKITVTGYINI